MKNSEIKKYWKEERETEPVLLQVGSTPRQPETVYVEHAGGTVKSIESYKRNYGDYYSS